jgi:hypothetical protein
MFFEVLFFVGILTKFDQNPGNYDEEITSSATIRDV